MNMQTESQETARIRHGIQCPECYGVYINERDKRFHSQRIGWECQDCGCQFSPPINLGK